MNKRKLIIAPLALSACLFSFAGCGSKDEPEKGVLDFKDFISVEYEGYDGEGYISIKKDPKLYEDEELLEKVYPSKKAEKAKEKLQEVMGYVYYSADNTSGLKNGDEVKVKVEYDEDSVKRLDVENEEFTITVEGLKENEDVDVFDKLNVTFEGYDGRGTVRFDSSSCHEFASTYVLFKADKNNKLSNGDKITVTADYSKSSAKYKHINVKSDSKEYTVEGLKETTKVDPFENLEITYTGSSPYITASVDSSKCSDLVNNQIRFYLDTDGNKYLANGDTFKVKASYSTYDADEAGFTVTQDEKEYTIAGQPEMVTSVDDLDLKNLHKEMNDKLSAITAAKYNDYKFAGVYVEHGNFSKIASSKELKSYVISLKNSFKDNYSKYTPYNSYIRTFEYKIIDTRGEEEKIYVAIIANNVGVDGEGKVTWDLELASKGDDSIDDIISDYITTKKEHYNISEVKASNNKDKTETTTTKAGNKDKTETTTTKADNKDKKEEATKADKTKEEPSTAKAE